MSTMSPELSTACTVGQGGEAFVPVRSNGRPSDRPPKPTVAALTNHGGRAGALVNLGLLLVVDRDGEAASGSGHEIIEGL